VRLRTGLQRVPQSCSRRWWISGSILDPGSTNAPTQSSPETDSATTSGRRRGYGVAVPLKIYAHCIDWQADAANQRITDALGARDAEPEPGGEEGGEGEMAS
jgi:hypothetical protein